MRLTALNPSFVRPLLPAGGLPAVNAVHTPALVASEPIAMELRERPEPHRTPLSIEEFVRFARNAGAI